MKNKTKKIYYAIAGLLTLAGLVSAGMAAKTYRATRKSPCKCGKDCKVDIDQDYLADAATDSMCEAKCETKCETACDCEAACDRREC